MGIFLKGWSTCELLSPVMMQEACAAMANSRNMLSFICLHSLKKLLIFIQFFVGHVFCKPTPADCFCSLIQKNHKFFFRISHHFFCNTNLYFRLYFLLACSVISRPCFSGSMATFNNNLFHYNFYLKYCSNLPVNILMV